MRQHQIYSEKKKKRIDKVLWVISLLTLIPFVYAGIYFSKTFINIWYLVIIGLAFGFFLGLTTFDRIKDISSQELKNHITFCVLVFGILLNFSLLWINFNFPMHEEKKYDVRVDSYAMSNRRTSSIATIEFAGHIKDIRLPIEDYELIKQGYNVSITIDKGLFGFYIILDKKLSTNK
jgi:heme/copper-type cytochrome/quinol oxidase subunit 4